MPAEICQNCGKSYFKAQDIFMAEKELEKKESPAATICVSAIDAIAIGI